MKDALALRYIGLVLRNRLGIVLVTAIAPAVWGSTYIVTTELLPPHRPLLAAVLRALPAGLLLIALTRRLPQGSWWWRSLVLGALNIGAFLALLFIAAYRLPGGVAATVGAVQPLITAGLSAALLGDRLTLRTVLSGIAGVAGVSLLVLRANAQLDVVGVVAALAGAVVMATGVVLSKRWTSPPHCSPPPAGSSPPADCCWCRSRCSSRAARPPISPPPTCSATATSA